MEIPKYSEGTKILAIRLSMKAEQMKMNQERMMASSSFMVAMDDLMSNFRNEDAALLSIIEAEHGDLVKTVQYIKANILAT